MSVKKEPMITKALFNKTAIKASVVKAELLELSRTAAELRTEAVVNVRRELSSGDSAMLNQQALSRVGQKAEGRVCVDVVSDDVIRVRYAEGTTVAENDTDMVVGVLPRPKACRIRSEKTTPKHPAGLAITTAALSARIQLDPFRLEIRDLKGRPVCGIGGPEKNNFTFFDSYNTGIARFGQDNAPIATENFDLAHDKAVYGFGEKFIRLNKVGQTIDLNMMDALGVMSSRSYKNVPFFVSTRGYGVFFNHSSLMTAWAAL